MFATNGRQRLMSLGSPFAGRTVPIAPAAGIVVAGMVAIAFLLMPIVVIEDMAMDSGVAALFTAAAPPFGLTARLAVAFFAALAAGGVVWFGLFLTFGTRTVSLGSARPIDGVPVLRRADAHPDAPARRPVFANSDLGTPFLDVKAEPVIEDAAPWVEEPLTEPVVVAEACDVPDDLDTPIAAYRTPDDLPLPDPDPVPVLTPVSAPRFAPHERIETFGLTQDDEPSAPLPQATIHDLLERLERGVAKRQPDSEPKREQTLEETLDALRALARRVG